MSCESATLLSRYPLSSGQRRTRWNASSEAGSELSFGLTPKGLPSSEAASWLNVDRPPSADSQPQQERKHFGLCLQKSNTTKFLKLQKRLSHGIVKLACIGIGGWVEDLVEDRGPELAGPRALPPGHLPLHPKHHDEYPTASVPPPLAQGRRQGCTETTPTPSRPRQHRRSQSPNRSGVDAGHAGPACDRARKGERTRVRRV